jgi:hypothetical protein
MVLKPRGFLNGYVDHILTDTILGVYETPRNNGILLESKLNKLWTWLAPTGLGLFDPGRTGLDLAEFIGDIEKSKKKKKNFIASVMRITTSQTATFC